MATNLSPTKNPIPEQEPNVRNKNFDEVALGYTVELALDEANRCLQCRRPQCVTGCPVNVKIPDFIKLITEQDFKGAYHKILEDSSLPAICGRVCPQENQCESKCVRGIKGEPVGIGRLERFVADWVMQNADEMPEQPARNGHKVAVVGSGPSGLACASDLAKLGYDVTIFEHLHKAGGVLAYGIPEFRLPKALVQKEIDKLTALGVEIRCDATVGKALLIDELFGDDPEIGGYEAVFIGSGAGLPVFQNIPGLNYCGVFSANEFLTRINLMKAFDERYDTPLMPISKVCVVGAGNVAMDAARCAKRLGAEVTVVYRRGEKEIPARKEEYEHAKEEDIVFKLLTNPVEILADENGWVRGIRCIEMELGEPDARGRRRPVEKPGSEFEMECDAVIMALGTSPNPLLRKVTPDLEYTEKGGIVADEHGVTTKKGVFAGGDAVTGAATVIKAMGAGKEAAAAIDRYIMKK
jgi:glutamate synthase (NADPH/NADH) small chain